jgi:regulator of sigma E protease
LDFLAATGGTLIGTVLPFLVVLTVVVFVHELGHFWVARRVGVAVAVFSIGFGPELVGWNDRKGTRWRISAVPLGGYVRFIDDANAASQPGSGASDVPGAFQSKGLAARAAVVAAGPFANFLFAIAVLAVLFYAFGKPMIAPVAGAIEPDSPAAEAGLRPGDRILAIDGSPIESFSDIQRIVVLRNGVDLAIDIDRSGEQLTVHATPRNKEIADGFGGRQIVPVLGLRQTNPTVELRTYGPVGAVGAAVEETWSIVDSTLSSVAGMFSGRTSTSQISGPIGIARVSGQVAAMGLIPLINLAAILSISIGLINLFPIPMLDGGHLTFYAIEALRGRPLPERAQEIGYGIGFAIVLGLMAFGVLNDILKIAAG